MHYHTESNDLNSIGGNGIQFWRKDFCYQIKIGYFVTKQEHIMMTNTSFHFFVPLCAPGLNIVRPKTCKESVKHALLKMCIPS